MMTNFALTLTTKAKLIEWQQQKQERSQTQMLFNCERSEQQELAV